MAIEVSKRMSLADLHAAAKLCTCGRAAGRMMAIANVLSGMKRCKAAASIGLERQALRDAILAYNEDGLDGLDDRPRSGRQYVLIRASSTRRNARRCSRAFVRAPIPRRTGAPPTRSTICARS